MRPYLYRQRKDRLFSLLLVLWIGWALAACASAPRPGAGPHAPASAGASPATANAVQGMPTTIPALATQGILSGEVLAGPTCPVERAEDPCPPKPVSGRQVLVETPAGAVIAKATTDARGQFQVALAPGTYTLTIPGGHRLFGGQQEKPVQAAVRVGQITHVQILLDTGIR